MIYPEAVMDSVCTMASVETKDIPKLHYLCIAAADMLEKKLRPGTDASDTRVVQAAAALAFRDYMLIRSASEGNAMSFKAGDISVSGDGKTILEAAERYVDVAMAAASEFLYDNDFVFTVM